MRDERTTPHRALLAERILKCLDATDTDHLRMYETLVMYQIGESRLVEYYLDKSSRCGDQAVKPLLSDPEEHRTIQNARQRDTRIHPNWRFILAVEAMNEDAQTAHERLFYTTIIFTTCSDLRKHFKFIDKYDDSVPEAHVGANSNGMLDDARKYLDAIMGGTNDGSS